MRATHWVVLGVAVGFQLGLLAGIYLICSLLSMVFTMGDFTNV